MRDRIFNYVAKKIKENYQHEEMLDITMNSNLDARGIGLDSIEILGLFVDLENDFQIEIDGVDYYKITTISSLVEYIQNKVNQEKLTVLSDLWSNNIALVEGDTEYTYRQFKSDIIENAKKLKKIGINEKDKVILKTKNSYVATVLFFSIIEIDAVPVLVDWTANSELEYITKECGAKLVIEENEFETATSFRNIQFKTITQKIPEKDILKNAYLIHYTSGTTGNPNGVIHDIASYRNMITHFRKSIKNRSSDIFLLCLPFSHGYGLSCVFLASIYSGAKLIIMKQFVPREAINLINTHKVTHFYAVPQMYDLMLRTIDKKNSNYFSSIEYCCSSSLKLNASTIRQFYEKTGIIINQEYGSAETGVISYTKHENLNFESNCVGKPLYPENIRIMSDGELCISSPEKAIGYCFGTEFDAWYCTGDIVELKNEMLYLKGRKSEQLYNGARKVYPEEIIQKIKEIDGIEDVHIFQKNHLNNSGYICAIVVLKNGKELTKFQILTHLEKRMDKYKIPLEFMRIDKIIRNNIGKVTEKCMKEMIPNLILL